jgi:hypothetical protein
MSLWNYHCPTPDDTLLNTEQCWNDFDKDKLNDSKKNLFHCNFVHANPKWTALGSNLGLHGENVVTNHLCYGMVLVKLLVPLFCIWKAEFDSQHADLLC